MKLKYLLALIPLFLLGAGCNSTTVDQTQVIQVQNRKIDELTERLNALAITSDTAASTTEAPEPSSQPQVDAGAIPGIIAPDSSLLAAFQESAYHSHMADIAELSCFPQSRFNCTADGCTPYAPATYYFVDYGVDQGTYFRCDAKGCDPYPVTVTQSGIYTQFSPSGGQAMLFKVTSGNEAGTKGEFVDVATMGTGTIVSFGKCN